MSGCLLIGTRIGGIEDIIRDGQTGFLVPSRDVSALAKQIQYTIYNLDNLVDMRIKGREETVKKLDWKYNFDELQEVASGSL